MISISRFGKSVAAFSLSVAFVTACAIPLGSSAQVTPYDTTTSGSGGTVFTNGASGAPMAPAGGTTQTSSAPAQGGAQAGFNAGFSGGSSGAGISGISSCSSLGSGGFSGIVDCIIVFFNYFVYIIMSLTVIYVIVGAFNMISSEEKRGDGKQMVYYGIIGLFVMGSIWGFVNILDSTFKLSGNSPITPTPLQR